MPNRSRRPHRDQSDDYWTYRFRVSEDGGESWSQILGMDDTGMYDEDSLSTTGAASYNFGTLVDLENNIHFVVVLNSFSDDENLNPFDRVNGVYDVKSDIEGEDITYTLIADEEDNPFTWSDCGMDADGNLYAIWVETIGDESASLWASRSGDGGEEWSDPFLLFDDLDPVHNYPHITPHIGEFFYVLYEIPNPDNGSFDQFILKVAASLEDEAEVINPRSVSGVYYSYYVGANNPIDQDIEAGYVYFCHRNRDVTAVAVGNSSDQGDEWNIEAIRGANRYPSVGLDFANEMPWIFSNFGVPPGEEWHRNWFSFDELGYNGGDWLPQQPHDRVPAGENLFVHQGVWTTEGRLVTGCNVWNFEPAITPSGFQVIYSDNGGEDWSDSERILDIWDEEHPMIGGFIPQVTLLAGMENTIWIAFASMYGETDTAGPEIRRVRLSSFERDESWIVTALIADQTGVEDARINWLNNDIGGAEWEFGAFDSTDAHEDGNGLYWFTIPSDFMHGRRILDGHRIGFYIFSQDVMGHLSESDDFTITVGEGWDGDAPGPRLRVEPMELNFEAVALNDTVQENLFISNIGDDDLIIDDISVVGQYFIIEPAEGILIQPDDVIEFPVTFAPGEFGEFEGQLVISPDHPILEDLEILLFGRCGVPEIQVQPGEIAFPVTRVGGADTMEVAIRNNGGAVLILIEQLLHPGDTPFDLIARADGEIQPDSASVAMILFAPGMVGDFEAEYILQTNDPDSRLVRIPITGSAGAPGIAVDPFFLEFNDVQTGMVDSLAVIVSNAGIVDLLVERMFIAPRETPFSIGSGGGRFSLDAGEVDTSWIHFSPELEGEYEAALYVISDDPFQPAVEIPLLGNALFADAGKNMLPGHFLLGGIYPNPFNNVVKIRFGLPTNMTVRMKVFDISSREIVTLIDGDLDAGYHESVWKAGSAAAGIYIMHMQADGFSAFRKVVLVK